MDNKEPFIYNYSAKEQDEIKKIREKYSPKEETSIDRLRRLDHSVTQKGTALSLVFGVAGTLVLGIGMSMAMVMNGILWFILGVIVGMVGIAVLSLAYPVYKAVIKKEKERIAPEILRLADELMKK